MFAYSTLMARTHRWLPPLRVPIKHFTDSTALLSSSCLALLPAHRRAGPAPRGGIRGPCPPNELLCPPTFHPLPSLLNVIDFESESETDKTAHIRNQLHALVSISNCTRSQIARFPPETPTHTTWFVPP